MKYDNIIHQLNYITSLNPNKIMMIYLDENKNIKEKYTYKQFKIITDRLAKYFVTLNEKQALIVYPPGLDFIVAFISCLKSKIIPIPVYPPNPYFLKKDLILFCNIVKQSNVKIALTNSEYNWATTFANFKGLYQYQWPDLKWITTNNVSIQNKTILPDVGNNDIAFIQYTSGSCSFPKPVIVRHKNLVDNVKLAKHGVNCNEDSIIVSWLPQYHDFGLIASRIIPFLSGSQCIYISPYTFIKNPILYLELCSQYKCTHIQGPNFMYKLMARKWLELKNKPNINLSSIYNIFNAAEPINDQDYQFFYQTFKEYGLKKEALATGYGLAESVCYVCCSGSNNIRGGRKLNVDTQIMENENKIKIIPDRGKEILGCGIPFESVDIKIVNNNKVLEDLEVGEVYISSKSVADEYLIHEINNIKYMSSGDLGFIYQKELYITGRCKDLIILNGKNYYPQDFEWVIEQNDSIKKGSTVVFEDNKK